MTVLDSQRREVVSASMVPHHDSSKKTEFFTQSMLEKACILLKTISMALLSLHLFLNINMVLKFINKPLFIKYLTSVINMCTDVN